MSLMSTTGYQNANVNCLKIKKTDKIWVSMKDVGAGLGVKSISYLVSKEIYDIHEKRKLTKEETKRYKMTERDIKRGIRAAEGSRKKINDSRS